MNVKPGGFDPIGLNNTYLNSPGNANRADLHFRTIADQTSISEGNTRDINLIPAGLKSKFNAGDKAISTETPEQSPAGPANETLESKPANTAPQEDTFLFVLNSSGETNLAKPLIAAVKSKGYKVKVIHFRQNSKEILTGQGILEDGDFIDGTTSLYTPRVGNIFHHEIDTTRVAKLVGTPHHAYCRFAFSKARESNIPTVALVDLGIPGTSFGFRHTFYKSLSMADRIVVPNDTIKKQLQARCEEVSTKSGFKYDMKKVSTGGNPGFEAFRLLVNMHKADAEEIRRNMGIGKDDMVLSFSSQPTPDNGKILKNVGKAMAQLSKRNPGKKIHMLMCPHPRDLYNVGLKNLFGTETGITISQKAGILKEELKDNPQVVIHEMPKYTMEKAAALSSIVLTESSTTAYECAHSDIPSTFVRTEIQGTGGSFPQYKRIPTACGADELLEIIEKTLSDPPQNLSKDLAGVVKSDLKPYMDVIMEGLE